MTAQSVLPPPPTLLTDFKDLLYALGHVSRNPAEREHSTVEELANGVLLFRMRTTASLNCQNSHLYFKAYRYEPRQYVNAVSKEGPWTFIGISHFDLNMIEAYGWQVMLRVRPGECQKDAEAPNDSQEHRISHWIMEDMTDQVI